MPCVVVQMYGMSDVTCPGAGNYCIVLKSVGLAAFHSLRKYTKYHFSFQLWTYHSTGKYGSVASLSSHGFASV